VRSVQQPDLAFFERQHVVGEDRPGILPAGSFGREVTVQHPVAERLGDDRALVAESGEIGRDAGVLGGSAGRDPVHHRRHHGHVVGEPRGEVVVKQFGELGEHAPGQRTVGCEAMSTGRAKMLS
jgi:hypothetical protein